MPLCSANSARTPSTMSAGAVASSASVIGHRLRLPAAPRAQRAQGAPARERQDGREGAAPLAVVAGVADVADLGVARRRAHSSASTRASSSVGPAGRSSRRPTAASAAASRTPSSSASRSAPVDHEGAVARLRGEAPRAEARRGTRRRRRVTRTSTSPRAGPPSRRCARAVTRRPSRSTTTASQVRVTSSSTWDDSSTRDAELAGEAAHQAEHLLAAGRVEAVRRLVEHHQLGRVDERLGQLGALLHAGREGADQARALLLEADLEEHLRRPQHGGAARQAAQLGHVHHQVARRHLERQAVALGHVAEAAADLAAGGARRRCRAPRRARRRAPPGRAAPSSASTCRRRSRRAGRWPWRSARR